MKSLDGKVAFITGASAPHGIGRACALRLAAEGASVVVTDMEGDMVVDGQTRPRSDLLTQVVSEVVAAGGKGLALPLDVADADQISSAVDATVDTFGRLDILVNNASAINLSNTLDVDMKRFDLMHQINFRGTFLCSKLAVPHLKNAKNPHVLNIAPPLSTNARWFAPHLAYSMAKFGMSYCVLAMAEEFRGDKIAFNGLWPRTAIATAAVQNHLGGDSIIKLSRKPEIMADAAYEIFSRSSEQCTGNFFIDDEVTASIGIKDHSNYQVDPSLEAQQLIPDFFIDQ